MSVYLITFETPHPVLCAALKAKFPDHRDLHDNAIAFRAEGSAQSILKDLEFPESEKSGIFIGQLSADYWGYGKKAFWDWLSNAFRGTAGG